MKYRAIIFDMDGTLLNTLDDIADSANYILHKYEYPQKTLEDVRMAVGNGARMLMKALLPNGEQTPDFERILEDYGAYYRDHCQIKTRPYEGVPELLQRLRDAGIKTAIVSNKGDAAVKALNLQYFGESINIAIGERKGIRRKPEPDSVLAALKELNCPRECALYVGDSEVDRATAANAGMDCMLVSWGFRGRKQLERLQAAYLIDSPEELLRLL